MHAPLVVFVIALIWRALLISLCNLCHKHAREEGSGGRGVEEGLYEGGERGKGVSLIFAGGFIAKLHSSIKNSLAVNAKCGYLRPKSAHVAAACDSNSSCNCM